MPTIEIVRLQITPGKEKLGDPDNDGAKAIHQGSQIMLNAPGCQRVHVGNTVEDSQIVRMLIDWDNYDAHQTFRESEAYGSFLSQMRSIQSGKPEIFHVDFHTQEDYNAALAAPVTEIVAFYFDGQVPTDYGPALDKAKASFSQAEGFRAFAWGVSRETDVENDGVKGQVSVCVVGWTSVEAHMAIRGTPIHTTNLPILRSTAKNNKLNHIQALQVLKD